MESNRTKTITYQKDSFEFADNLSGSDDVEARLNSLLAINRETANQKTIFQNQQERFEAEIMEFPIKTEKAFGWFGLMLGTFPPLALFIKFIVQNVRYDEDFWVVPLLFFVNLVCGVVGFFSGKLMGKMMAEIEKYSWTAMLLLAPFIGILWGIMTGGAGGLFIFVIGAFFGAMIAAMVGMVSLPIFSIFHRLLKKGDSIERDHFLPIAMGLTLIISALFLGLNIR